MRWIIATHATFVTVAMAVATAGAENGVPAKVLPLPSEQSDLRRDLTYLSSTNSAAA